MSRTRLYGSTNGTPFHLSTITLEDVPIPNANRPGAADAAAATDCAITAGARVNAGTIAVPRRNDGAHCEARINVGVTEVSELLELCALLMERATEGHRHAGAVGQCHGAGR